MASVRQRRLTEDDSATDPQGDTSIAIRIDTDVFAVLSESTGDDSAAASRIEQWFDCWRA